MSVLSDLRAERGMPAQQAVAGGCAIHNRRNETTQEFVAIMDEHQKGNTRDDQEGRHSDSTATLTVPLRDIYQVDADLDELGTFTVDSLVWQIDGVTRVPGAYLVDLKRRSQKTMRMIRK
jgi:hypothetical protein